MRPYQRMCHEDIADRIGNGSTRMRDFVIHGDVRLVNSGWWCRSGNALKRTRLIRLERIRQFPDRLSEDMTGGIRNATLR